MAFAPALIGAGTSLLTGILGKGASKKAQSRQDALYQQALTQQQGQFNQTQANFQPYLTSGGNALQSIDTLLGQNGNDPQAAAIAALKASPAFTSQYGTGQDTILQNAAATGGLRGGNTQNSLAQFGSGLLSQVIQQQLANLGGLSSQGVGAANSIGQFGQANSSAITGLLGQQGQTDASGILGRAAITNNTINGISGLASGLFGGGSGAVTGGATGLTNGMINGFQFPNVISNLGSVKGLGW